MWRGANAFAGPRRVGVEEVEGRVVIVPVNQPGLKMEAGEPAGGPGIVAIFLAHRTEFLSARQGLSPKLITTPGSMTALLRNLVSDSRLVALPGPAVLSVPNMMA
jgi:hypothetical protein